ncbi:uncharacterized protein K452DRAFT_271836 [Aplosporella prunicola CBS 121167]|uniref:PRISE-like Rossmann-fold domain-containing protein n=1 Tax=Aplosporella prunicola CBS 121167 TaxID=1176127 RepID=A0A6A6BD18_9PEZI|nr:uncharacterized protein K452DRAFT_271836 [Aplosporella prunicola CBS 121167]KAF2141185.1 hypothetical protein K452DRAFT_271836 [Aplosporella prunicola CBS 121167]
MPSAIVTGATGILGRGIVNELGSKPDEWSNVYALSRSKKDSYPSNVHHNHLDLTSSAEQMAKDLKDIEAEYVFFAAYVDVGSADENNRVNGDMFSNFLKTFEINGTVSKIKRIILVCGLKQYGVHLGNPKQPMEENDPWLPEPPSNFYYRQQRTLHDFSKKHNTEWVVTYSNEVVGFAKGNYMNLASCLGLYAAVHTVLGNGKELPFPGSQAVYTKFDVFTYTKLHAQFCRWAALEPRAGNAAFNVVNGDVESWQNLWPKLAARYNLTVPADQFSRPAPDASDYPMGDVAPLSYFAKELGVEGHTPPSRLQQRIDLERWSKKPEVRDAWATLARRHGLDEDAIEKATWGFAAFVLGRDYDLVANMSKARKLGWTGYADSWESFEEVFGELEDAKVLPRSK